MAEDYGFLRLHTLDETCYTEQTLSHTGISWFTTQETAALAKNHCGAVAAANVFLYLLSCHGRNEEVQNRPAFFKQVHRFVGNGPLLSISGQMEVFALMSRIPLGCYPVFGFRGIQQAINKGAIVSVQLMYSPRVGHWTLCTGWRIDQDGKRYLRLVSGWNPDAETFYCLDRNNGCHLVTATAYRWAGE